MPDAVLTQALSTVTLGEPQVWHGLTVFPLMAPDERPPAYDTFGMAHSAGAFLVTEVSESGTVGQLRAENTGSRPVLLLDGEEVIGAKQNRIINLTILVPAHTTMTIPVTCVEQGRWSLQSKAFSESGRAMFADGRARKMRDVTRSMRERGGAAADQGAVWDSVAERLDMNRASSPTGAMSAMYEQGRAGIDGYVTALEPLPLQVGAVFGMNGRIVGAELFDSSASYAVSAPKIIRSYAVQHSGDGAVPVPETEASAFIARLCSVEPTEHSPPGAGRQLRFEEGDTLGAALVHEDRVVHLAAFRVEDAAPPPRRARELIR
ncbi:MAG TPA: DUF6569 family protein, partial [Longimicrobiales bacterium]|nr:DUF6569 family protein [Longimicrobiales bacterium]